MSPFAAGRDRRPDSLAPTLGSLLVSPGFVACPSLGETGSSSMTIAADFRGGIGPIPGAYWQDGKDHRLNHRHRRRCARSVVNPGGRCGATSCETSPYPLPQFQQ